MQTERSVSHEIERYKVMTDYMKQLTVLSTGSIVLMTTFMEKIFVQPHWKALTVVSMIGFMVSIVGSGVVHTVLIFDFPPRSSEEGRWGSTWGGAVLVATWLGFLAGILSLAIFSTANLLLQR